MHLDLKHGRLHSSVVQYLADGLRANVAETNVLDQAFSMQGFDGSPGLLVSHTCIEDHLAVSSSTVESSVEALPLGRVAGLVRHVGESDREMDQVQIKVVKTEVR